MVFAPANRFGTFRPMLSLCALALAALAACTRDGPTAARAPSAVRVSGALLAAGGGNVSVTTVVADNNISIAPALQIRSDGLGAYQNSSSLTSIIQGIGAWELDSYDPKRSTRTVYLDFSQPIAGSGPNGGNPVAIPSGLYKVHAISKCNLYGNNMLTLAPGATMPCPLHFGKVYSGGVEYAVQMNPYNSVSDTAYPETNYANITCTYPTSGSGPCTQWSMTPSGTFVGGNGTQYYRNVGALLKYGTGKGQATVVKEGDFYFSFAIGVTNP
jgi:hypothetical protein